MYLIFHIRNSAWVGDSVPHTSDHTKARRFTHKEAMEICSAQKLQGRIVSFPVSLKDLENV